MPPTHVIPAQAGFQARGYRSGGDVDVYGYSPLQE